MVDTTETVNTISDMARTLRRYANEFERITEHMKESGDVSYAAEVVSGVASLMLNLKLDLLVTRSLRAITKNK